MEHNHISPEPQNHIKQNLAAIARAMVECNAHYDPATNAPDSIHALYPPREKHQLEISFIQSEQQYAPELFASFEQREIGKIFYALQAGVVRDTHTQDAYLAVNSIRSVCGLAKVSFHRINIQGIFDVFENQIQEADIETLIVQYYTKRKLQKDAQGILVTTDANQMNISADSIGLIGIVDVLDNYIKEGKLILATPDKKRKWEDVKLCLQDHIHQGDDPTRQSLQEKIEIIHGIPYRCKLKQGKDGMVAWMPLVLLMSGEKYIQEEMQLAQVLYAKMQQRDESPMRIYDAYYDIDGNVSIGFSNASARKNKKGIQGNAVNIYGQEINIDANGNVTTTILPTIIVLLDEQGNRMMQDGMLIDINGNQISDPEMLALISGKEENKKMYSGFDEALVYMDRSVYETAKDPVQDALPILGAAYYASEFAKKDNTKPKQPPQQPFTIAYTNAAHVGHTNAVEYTQAVSRGAIDTSVGKLDTIQSQSISVVATEIAKQQGKRVQHNKINANKSASNSSNASQVQGSLGKEEQDVTPKTEVAQKSHKQQLQEIVSSNTGFMAAIPALSKEQITHNQKITRILGAFDSKPASGKKATRKSGASKYLYAHADHEEGSTTFAYVGEQTKLLALLTNGFTT